MEKGGSHHAVRRRLSRPWTAQGQSVGDYPWPSPGRPSSWGSLGRGTGRGGKGQREVGLGACVRSGAPEGEGQHLHGHQDPSKHSGDLHTYKNCRFIPQGPILKKLEVKGEIPPFFLPYSPGGKNGLDPKTYSNKKTKKLRFQKVTAS